MDGNEECIQAAFCEMSACEGKHKTTSYNRLCSLTGTVRHWKGEVNIQNAWIWDS